ncbi:hypothetical protein L1994_04250 [Methanomicrobium antiquum]|uniref:Uncharacterized protein n=1 Tax=Methanomicrobium antiquum TaxID=487686 RepID=A0AAF0FNN7_9EURY|nr:hypothetical protein [Methanomicrobium antiquum]MDD3977154.1 hypothetical protein [Methanomicrobium sp.]WFN37608.1 hypothetical protein L1994_04250 [Methanomicrobium antiquum]
MENSGEKLYDVIVPPGVPRKIIIDVSEKFQVEIIDRPRKMKFANMDGDVRNLIAFRCDADTAQKVHEYLFSELKKFVEEE